MSLRWTPVEKERPSLAEAAVALTPLPGQRRLFDPGPQTSTFDGKHHEPPPEQLGLLGSEKRE